MSARNNGAPGAYPQVTPQEPRTTGDYMRDRAVQGAQAAMATDRHEALTKAPSTYPIVSPAPQTEKTRVYDILTCQAGISRQQYRHLGAPLAPGQSFIFRCAAFPEKWRLSAFSDNGTNQLGVASHDSDTPPLVALMISTTGIMLTEFPARGKSFAVRAPATNTGNIIISLEAIAGLDF